MDRAKTILLLYKFYSTGLTEKEAEEVLRSYCLEKGKENKDIDRFLLALLMVPECKTFCLDYAFRYYEQKYFILKLFKLPSPLDANQGQVILIY